MAVDFGCAQQRNIGLMAADPAWREMVARLSTVPTRSAQLWLDATEAEAYREHLSRARKTTQARVRRTS